MAQRTHIVLIDDIDGKEIEAGEGKTIAFSYSGVDYSIDLSDKNAQKLDKALEPYISAGQRVGGRRTRHAAPISVETGVDSRAVRAWAESNGIELSARGRIPANVVAQYREAGN